MATATKVQRGLWLQPGDVGEATVSPMRRVDGRWIVVARDRRVKPEAWRARVFYRGWDGSAGEVSARRATKQAATVAAQQAARDRMAVADTATNVTGSVSLSVAVSQWLDDLARTDSGRSPRTVAAYRGAYERAVLGVTRDTRGRLVSEVDTPLKHLTLAQANDPQRLTRFLREVAEARGTATVKHVRAVLAGTIGEAVAMGVLPVSGMRSVGRITAQVRQPQGERDTRRGFTPSEQAEVLAFASAWADEARTMKLHPGTCRQREALADLCYVLAGSGMRIGEALRLHWTDVDLTAGRVDVPGTKSAASRRTITLPGWVLDRLGQREERQREWTGEPLAGLVFPAPRLKDQWSPWDPANCSGAVTALLKEAGHPWARSHAWRRTVASRLGEQGVPLARIADQLGHADPGMTASTYLSRSPSGDKADLAALL